MGWLENLAAGVVLGPRLRWAPPRALPQRLGLPLWEPAPVQGAPCPVCCARLMAKVGLL